MDRITVDEVTEAYAKTGLIPVFDTYRAYHLTTDEVIGACALVALREAWKQEHNDDGYYEAKDLSNSYIRGFIIGFDGKAVDDFNHSHTNVDDVLLGFEDGKAARDAVNPASSYTEMMKRRMQQEQREDE